MIALTAIVRAHAYIASYYAIMVCVMYTIESENIRGEVEMSMAAMQPRAWQ